MACPTILTGDRFLVRVIDHIDCQAQFLGSYGYQALGQPGSLASNVMLGLLTLFIALFAFRLLFGPAPGGRDVVFDLLKIGIVLTLAFSWPAFRTVVHDVVVDGPAQVTSIVAAPALVGQSERLADRVQKADTAMVRLAELGTGRNTGVTLEGGETGASFAGTSLQDDTAIGYGRMFYLSGIMGSLVLIRIVAALLLALAPLAAGLLLFEATRGLFSGWIKGLILSMLGSIGVTIVLLVELSILEPWLADALRVRVAGYATPSAAIELFAISSAFLVVKFAMIWLLAKVAFARGWMSVPTYAGEQAANLFSPKVPVIADAGDSIVPTRVQRIADNVETVIKREQNTEMRRLTHRSLAADSMEEVASDRPQAIANTTSEQERLGSSYRRPARRNTFESLRGDRQS
ncbi:type IV secretion system protein [Pontixanthobacter sp. CEM42]|uniref:type IV secretion system protein n=1 Tax=Pontixanthobacter sp. CEM42 TaxID=2792077 RepID=UPI001ADFEF14|nr:type IV secretion system protein [Pontixanthobacter sp. CEM42]